MPPITFTNVEIPTNECTPIKGREMNNKDNNDNEDLKALSQIPKKVEEVNKNEILELFKKKEEEFKEFIPIVEKNKLVGNVIKGIKSEYYKITGKNFKIEKNKVIKRGKFFKIVKIKEKKIKVKHNKLSIDNIMKKVKIKYIEYLVFSINSILEKNEELKKYKLSKLPYDFKIKLKKENNTSILHETIQIVLSYNEKNKKNIAKILENKNHYEKLNYIFNLTFEEWIDIFTMKKESEITFEGFDSLLKKILEKNKDDKRYLCNFIFCLYNFKRWIYCKKGRNPKNSKKDNKNKF